MKKLVMGFVGILMAFSLAACTPTQVAESTPQAARDPEGVDLEKIAESNAAITKGPDLSAPVYEMAFIYSFNDDQTGIVKESVDLEGLTEQILVQCLIEKGVLEQDTEALSFEIEGDEKAGPGMTTGSSDNKERIGTLNLSKIPTADGAKEQAMLNAIGNTFIENYELDKLKLLVNGENYKGTSITHGDGDYLVFAN